MSEKLFELLSMPASRDPVSLLAVDRAVSELRRGRLVAVRGGGGIAILVRAAESITPDSLEELGVISHSPPVLAITARRAAVLGLAETVGKIVTLTTGEALSAELIRDLADPIADNPLSEADKASLTVTVKETPTYNCESAAVALTKIARLLPAAVTAEIADPTADDLAAWAARHDLLLVDAGDIFQYDTTQARTLRAVSSARVPLPDAQNTRIIAFRPVDGGLEHLAIVIGEPENNEPVLTRLHSECFTGDLLGSLRCDCGDQLQGAIKEITTAGAGVLLYLAQEGRGIGLVNKLRAYELQDRGFDTMDANEQLGFDADERVYLPAAQILRLLGFARVRLLTNNPSKVSALSNCGIVVEERVPHAFPSNEHNESYLRTKAARGGHVF
ncbi:MAG: GTP cyclohydrolase II [Proteobacteria bacterium]|nr:GTP cyclohydrolase II [Pseudomonadota bacterium]